MNEAINGHEESLKASDLSRIDRVCDRFEAAWQAGDEPKLEDYLGDTPEPERSVLRRELLAIDAERRKQKAPPSLDEFVQNLTGNFYDAAKKFKNAVDPGNIMNPNIGLPD